MEINFKRITDLIIRYFVEHTATVLKILLTICLVILIITCLAHIGENRMDYEALVVLFYVAMFIGGFWFSSNIYKELHEPGIAYRFLTLPATNIEKLIYAWLLTSPLVIIVSFIIINFTAWIAVMFCTAIFDINYETLKIFDYHFGSIALLYIVIQPIFLLGALFFRKLNFFNTVLWLIIFSAGINILATIFVLIFFYPIHDIKMVDNFFKLLPIANFFTDWFVPGVKIFFWYIMAPFFLVVSYFKLKETEIK